MYNKFTKTLTRKVETSLGYIPVFKIIQSLMIAKKYEKGKKLDEYVQDFEDMVLSKENAKKHDKYVNNLPAISQEVITAYTSNLYVVINGYLRTGKIGLTKLGNLLDYSQLKTFMKTVKIPKSIKKRLDELDYTALSKLSTEERFNRKAELGMEILKMKSGKIFFKNLFYKFVKELDAVIGNAPKFDEEFFVFRGMYTKPNNINNNAYTERKGILSWSIDPKIAFDFGDHIQVVKVPKNFPFLLLRSISSFSYEQEVLFPTKTKYRKLSDETYTLKPQATVSRKHDFCSKKSNLTNKMYLTKINVKI